MAKILPWTGINGKVAVTELVANRAYMTTFHKQVMLGKGWLEMKVPQKRIYAWTKGMKGLDYARGGEAIHGLFNLILARLMRRKEKGQSLTIDNIDSLIETHQAAWSGKCLYPPVDNWPVFVERLIGIAISYAKAYSCLVTDFEFDREVGKARLKGKVDLIADDVIVEIKTGKPDVEKDLGQALHYVYLSREAGNKVSEVQILYLSYDEYLVRFDVTQFNHQLIDFCLFPIVMASSYETPGNPEKAKYTPVSLHVHHDSPKSPPAHHDSPKSSAHHDSPKSPALPAHHNHRESESSTRIIDPDPHNWSIGDWFITFITVCCCRR